MKNKRLIVGIAVVIAVAISVSFAFLKKETSREAGQLATESESQISYYTCGMHPSVRVSPKEYKKGDVNCPICNMKLIPVHKETAASSKKPKNPRLPSGRENRKPKYYGCGVDTEGKCPHCDSGKADTVCICGGHSFALKGEKINCPVCGKPLKELSDEEADRLKGVVSRVKIKSEYIKRAGVKIEPVRRLHLFKEIRTAGKVAYDPHLAIAQSEFLSSLKAFDRMKEGGVSDIKERALSLVESSKRKLQLLGLSNEQIAELEETREAQSGLVLPEKKMWIYGDVYEYELSWVKSGEKLEIKTQAFPGEIFSGTISSINPVLDPKTRAVRFRAEVENPDLKLKPEMYVDVVIKSMYVSPQGEHMVLAIPDKAVLDTGARKIVWVYKGNDEYEGRDIEVGPQASAETGDKGSRFYPVLKGLSEGEDVVTKANFLIDSQSQITGITASAYGGALGTEEKKASPAHQH